MESVIQVLNNVSAQCKTEIQARVEESLNKFTSLSETFIRERQNAAYSTFSLVDFDDKILTRLEARDELPPFLRIGQLSPTKADEKDKAAMTAPFLYPFSQANATTFVLSENDARNIHSLFSIMAFRLMLSLPREKWKMWFVDNNFGRDFNILNKLDGKIIGDSIITNPSELPKLVAELERTMIETYQKHLITEDTLEEYNRKAGAMGIPYKFVFISNFPAGFNEDSAEKLYSIINNGNAAKAGIFFFISIDESIPAPRGVDVDWLKEISAVIYQNSPTDYEIRHQAFSKIFNDSFDIVLDSAFPKNLETILQLINNRKETRNVLSFMPQYLQRLDSDDIWKSSSMDEIKIPIGYVNPQTSQYLQFGIFTNDYFGLIGGLPRMGKTNLLHNIILWGAMEYSPDELIYYLIDCKNGTGFNAYKHLPHVKILSISNDREFGASALNSLVDEMYRRATVFKEASTAKATLIENIQTYRRLTGEKMPRIFAIVDEFQVLFENEDKVARIIRATLNKLFREGPAFGISILLSSQGIGGVDVPIKNITWRLSFRLLSDIESQRILGNDGALALTRVGNAIINNQNGDKKSNIRFQVGMVGDELYKVVESLNKKYAKPMVRYISDGDTSGRLERNFELARKLETDSFSVNDRFCDIFIGEPAFIRETHAFIRIRRQQASNIVMVGKDLKSAITIVGLFNYMLSRQSSDGSQFFVVDCFNIDNEYCEKLEMLQRYRSNIKVSYSRIIAETVDQVTSLLDERMSAEEHGERISGRVCLSILYAQNCRAFKKDGYNASPITKKLIRLIKEGPEYGVHVLLHSLSYPGLQEIIDTSVMNEFENRVALDSGKSMSILTEQTSSRINDYGTVLLQGPEEFMTYNPDLVRVYSRYDQHRSTNNSIHFIDELLKL